MTARSPEPERVAERAYSIWEEEGRPHGRDHAHWQRAESELAGQPVTVAGAIAPEPAAEPAAKQPTRARRPAGAEPADGAEAAPRPVARARQTAAAPAPDAGAPKRGRARGASAS